MFSSPYNGIPHSNLLYPFDALWTFNNDKICSVASSNRDWYPHIRDLRGGGANFHLFNIEYARKFNFGHYYGYEKVVYDVVECNVV